MWLFGFHRSFQEKHISVYRNILSMRKKEDEIFRLSMKEIDRQRKTPFWEISSIDYTLHNFQIFVEFLERYKDDLSISDDNIELILEWFEELNLSFKFLCSGYYITSGIHLRWFFERYVKWLFLQKDNDYRNTYDSLISIFKKGEISYIQEVLSRFYINEDLMYKIYKYLSNTYIHRWKVSSEISFNKEKFIESTMLFSLVVTMISRLINISLGDSIDKYIQNSILKPITWEHSQYFSYVQRLFWYSFFSHQETYLFNFINDHQHWKKLMFEDIWFIESDLFSQEYLETHKS
jgi:hypothetical protein